MLNALSIDLEDYFMVSAFEGVVKREDWDRYESRIERNTHRLLDILNGSIRNPVRATFFCLGWIAERYPGLIKRIKEDGHEIACHGYAHKLIYHQSRDAFREDIKKAKSILENIIGEGVIGYRAPTFSITPKSQWAFEVLIEEGFKYDSSIFPIRHDFYGYPKAPRFPFVISMNGNNNFEFKFLNVEPTKPTNCSTVAPSYPGTSLPHFLINSTNSINSINGITSPGHKGLTPRPALRTLNFTPTASILALSGILIEFPLSTIRIAGTSLPISGGGYFRLLPYSLIKKGLERINEQGGHPFIFYLHPWEIDPAQPRMNSISRKTKFRHYVNLGKTEAKFKKLLEDFRFLPICDVLDGNTATKKQLLPQNSSGAYPKRSSRL